MAWAAQERSRNYEGYTWLRKHRREKSLSTEVSKGWCWGMCCSGKPAAAFESRSDSCGADGCARRASRRRAKRASRGRPGTRARRRRSGAPARTEGRRRAEVGIVVVGGDGMSVLPSQDMLTATPPCLPPSGIVALPPVRLRSSNPPQEQAMARITFSKR